jgi:hypothetical protein
MWYPGISFSGPVSPDPGSSTSVSGSSARRSEDGAYRAQEDARRGGVPAWAWRCGLPPLLTILAVLLAGAGLVEGQSSLATLQGVISDPSGTVIQDAQVTLTNQRTSLQRSVTTNAVGNYLFAALDPDAYTLSVSARGFAPAQRTLTLEVNQQMRLDFALSLHTYTQQVDIVGQSELLKTTDASLGEVIEPKMVRDLPLDGGHLLALAMLAPEVHQGFGAAMGNNNPLYWRPLQDSALVAGGARPNANVYLIDGAVDTDPTFNTMTLSPAPDAVSEFKVQTGSYSAEFGGGGGAQVNVVTRSGGNAWHGDAYEFIRNSAFDARSWNDVGMMDAGKTPHLSQNEYGMSVGGPIQKRRTFMFLNFEGFRLSQQVVNTETVPTAAERSGDFSQSSLTIYEPNSSSSPSAANPRTPFPNDSIAGSGYTISPVAAMVLKTIPLPNMGTAAGRDSNNYFDERTQENREDQGTIRVDHNFAGGNSLFAHYSIERERDFSPVHLPGFGVYDSNQAQNLDVSYIRILSAETLNRIWVAMSRLSMHRYSQNNFTNNYVSQLGIKNVGWGGYGAWGMPYFDVQGYTGFGDDFNATPVQDWDTVGQIGDVLTTEKGNHALSLGGDYRRFYWPMWGFFENRGYYQFTNGYTTRTGSNDGTGSAFADFLLGLPVVRQVQEGVPKMDLEQWNGDAFLQDNWRVTRNTTINLGLRYEYMSPLWDNVYPSSNIAFRDGLPYAYISGQNGMPDGVTYANKYEFAPRFGFTHMLGSGFVLRGGFGIFFTPPEDNTWCNQRHNPPTTFQVGQQNDNYVLSSNSFTGFNFPTAVLGRTKISFSAVDPHSPAQYIEQWNLNVQKTIFSQTVVEVGYDGTRGYHLQQMVLINNALPGPGVPGSPSHPRPYQTVTFMAGTQFPQGFQVASMTFPVAGINQLQNGAASWYDAGYVDVRRRFEHGLTFVGNFTWSKNESTAPDFRSPMAEAAIPQNDRNLAAEKGPACDVPRIFNLSLIYELPGVNAATWIGSLTKSWTISSIYTAQAGMPLTMQVFGDTANAGTLLGQNPIRANVTGAPLYPAGTHSSAEWFNPAAFAAPPAYTFGDAGRNSVYGPGLQNLDFALSRSFHLSESKEFQIRSEFFNALNHSNFGMPGNFVNTPQFGSITMASTPGRETEFVGRFVF